MFNQCVELSEDGHDEETGDGDGVRGVSVAVNAGAGEVSPATPLWGRGWWLGVGVNFWSLALWCAGVGLLGFRWVWV